MTVSIPRLADRLQDHRPVDDEDYLFCHFSTFAVRPSTVLPSL
jgi:hypothetical protein